MRAIAAAVLALTVAAVLPAAAGARYTQLRLRWPERGDVTIARVSVRLDLARCSRGSLAFRAASLKGIPLGAQSAYAVGPASRTKGHVLMDGLLVLALPIGVETPASPALTFKVRAFQGARASIVRFVYDESARAAQGESCATLTAALHHARQALWAFSSGGRRWAGVDPATFVTGAYDYGCSDGTLDNPLVSALLAPVAGEFTTWRAQPDGSAHVCTYLWGAPHASGTAELVSPSFTSAIDDYQLDASGLGRVDWTAPPGTYGIELKSARGDAPGGPETITPGTDGPAPPAQFATSPC